MLRSLKCIFVPKSEDVSSCTPSSDSVRLPSKVSSEKDTPSPSVCTDRAAIKKSVDDRYNSDSPEIGLTGAKLKVELADNKIQAGIMSAESEETKWSFCTLSLLSIFAT